MSKGNATTPPESSLMDPVLGLFCESAQMVAYEVPIGWRKIDLLVFQKEASRWTAVELKVRDWKKALSQAMVNHIVADRSYVALWHTSVPNALAKVSIFEHYRVGIIAVHATHAEVVLQFDYNDHDYRRDLQRQSTLKRLARLSTARVKDNAPVSLLSA